MNKTFYLLLFMAVAILASSCSKQRKYELNTPTDRNFFSSDAQIFGQTQKALSHFDKNEKLMAITKVEYYDAAQKTVALIYFISNNGESNIAFEKRYDQSSKTLSEKGVKELSCSGRCGSTPCQVRGVMKDGVLDYLECTCGGCEMHIITD